MKAIQITPPASITITDHPVPRIGNDEVLVKTLGCGLCGTDLLKINLQLLKKPTILGHEICGEVVEIGKNVQNYKKRDCLVTAHHVPCFECHYCRHKNYSMCETFKTSNLDPGGFAEYIRISAPHLRYTTFKITDDFPWQEAVFIEPLACCVRSIERLNLKSQDTILVVGLGSIGLMMAKLLKRFECHVIGLDLDTDRCENALHYGVDTTFLPFDLANNIKLHSTTGPHTAPKSARPKDFLSYILSITEERGLDGIIFTAGPAAMLNKTLPWIRNSGFINLFSHLAGEMGEIDTSELYHRELQIITTYSSSPKTLLRSHDILKKEGLNLKEIFTSYKPEEFEKAVNDMNQRKILKALIEF